MKLNCKRGDLAIVVNSLGWPELRHLIGSVVRVKKVMPSTFGAMWLVKHHFITAAADACLRPIRDPGDDAVDESHAYLPPVPHREVA